MEYFDEKLWPVAQGILFLVGLFLLGGVAEGVPEVGFLLVVVFGDGLAAGECDPASITGGDEVGVDHDGARNSHHDLVLPDLSGGSDLAADGAVVEEPVLLPVDESAAALSVGLVVGVGIVGVVVCVEDHDGGVPGAVGGLPVDDCDG